MNLTQETDFTTLGWIKPELDSTLKEARHALERYAENPADVQAVRDCAAGLHTTYGTLHMVELYGAALVTEEMERVARGIADGSIAPREDIYAVLMRGFLQLPDYIERLQSGHKDIPIVLLPLLNDLRAARGERLLSESVLFAPNIDAKLPAQPERPLHPEVLRSNARSLRNDYGHSLLRWIREPASSAPLARITNVLESLHAGSSDDASRRLWWIAGAVAEGLQSGAIEVSVAVKLLFGKLDREIKRLIDDGEAALASAQTKDLVKNLLYYLAHAKTRGERARAVAEFYNLDNLLPTQEELEHAHGSISGHNRALLDTVAGGIREDLLRVKETLNVYLHSPRRNPADLAAQADTLGGLADTFGMLGMGQPRQLVREQRDAINRIVNGEAEANEGNLLDIAGSLLVVEASLDDHIARLGARTEAADAAPAGEAPRTEVVRLLYVLMQEALVNIVKVKESIVAFIEAPWDHAHLESTPRLLVEVAGALDMLGLRDAAKPVDAMVHYIRHQLLDFRSVPERSQIDAFVDAVAAIEYYIEAVREQRGNRDRVLEMACANLAKLGVWPEISTAGDGSAMDIAATQVVSPAVAVQTYSAPPSMPAALPEVDEELRQVFLDEMDDEMASLRKHFPLWRADPEATEDLKIVRRSFHTLKGSGRLVGALALGDFAWKIENMLNRVLDRSIAASPPLMQVVGHAIGVLPRYRDDFARHEHSSFTMDGFSAAVDRLCAGDTSPVDESQFGVQMPAAAVAEAVPATAAEPSVGTSLGDAVPAEPDVVPEPVAIESAIEAPIHLELEPLQLEPLVEIEPIAAPEVRVEAGPVVEVEGFAAAETPIEVEHGAGTQRTAEAEHVPDAEPAFDVGHSIDLDSVAEPMAQEASAFASAADGDGLTAAEIPAEPVASAAQVDQLLLEVLRSEADAHLAVVDATVARGQRFAIREDLVRAVHTLNGAFAMVEAPHVTGLLAPLEGWLARSRNAGHVLDAGGVAVLEGVSAQVKATLLALESGAALPDSAQLAARIVTLREGVHAGEAIVHDLEPPVETVGPAVPAEEQEGAAHAAITTPADVEATPQAEVAAEDVHAHAVESVQVIAATPATGETAAEVSGPIDLPEQHDVASAQAAASAELPVETAAALPADDSDSAILAYDALLAHSLAMPAVEPSVVAAEPPPADIAIESVVTTEQPIAAAGAAEPSPEPQAEPIAFAEAPASGSAAHAAAEPAPAEPSAPAAFVHEPVTADGEMHPVPDIDEDLLDIFVLEAQEILDRSDALVLRLRGAPGDTGLLDELRRDLHTIKGGANMSALAPIGHLGHAMESLLEDTVERGRAFDGAMLHAVEQGFDTLHTLVQATAARQPTRMPSALIARIEALSRGEPEVDAQPAGFVGSPAAAETPAVETRHDTVSPATIDESVAQAATEEVSALPVEREGAGEASQPADVPQQDAEPVFAGSEYIRVRATQLDAMVNGASEVAIYRSRLEQQLASYRANVVEMEATVSRLREQMRRLELEAEAQMASRFQREGDASTFDPLELDRFSQLQQLSRSLAESMSDLAAIQVGFDQLTRQSESLLMQQSRVSADLQESLMRTRMVPFDSLVPALRRTLRQTATSLGKEALLRVEGAQGEMDRTLLERMKAPLDHMLRNALVHGIEDVPERLAAGKPIEGNVRIALAREATETVLRISDDGRGLDRAAIRRRAIERGLLAADARIGDRELDAFILASGFSTAESLTQLAGRGVGMDVVANQIKQLGGSLAIESTPGRGAAFTVRLPFTLGVTQAIIVRLGDASYAIPMNAVQGAVHVVREELDLRLAAEEPEYVYAGEAFPIIELAPQLGEVSPALADDAHVPLLIVRSGDQRAAVRVDHVLGSREIVVKSVGPQITSVPGILGATIMGDGSVLMILDLAPLLRRVASQRAQGIVVAAPPVAARVHRRRLIMVVDDSITMRKATSRVLEREEMEVVTAKDGIDAIEKLADRIPDLVVLDIEMPRMDGYQFAEHMKGDPRTAQVPIIMVTSRTGDKHRQRAQEIGVEGYLGKPYQDVELIANIRGLLGMAQ
ncbi:MAG: Hpt domain-containing protein [Proteobacteria bacterium]|nr:Hpt domain-containing protein [Pseudomonadota bacterium]